MYSVLPSSSVTLHIVTVGVTHFFYRFGSPSGPRHSYS